MLLNLVFIGTTTATLFAIYFKFPNKNDFLLDSFRIELLIVPAVILAGVVNIFFNSEFSYRNFFFVFPIYLETLAMIPQIIFVKKTGESECFTTNYIFALVYYRALHLTHLYLVKMFLNNLFGEKYF